jgi:hypothetical protein
MTFLQRVWRGEFSLGFTFWVMGCLFPLPLFAAKYFLREAGVFLSKDQGIFLAGQVFLWVEWSYFAFITVALWNASGSHLKRAAGGAGARSGWGRLGKGLALASGLLAAGSFANLSGLTALIFGKPIYIGMGGG